MTEAARERRKRTSNVLRQRLEAVASYAATVKAPEEEGPRGVARWEKTCGEYVTRGKPSGKSAQARAGLMETAQSQDRQKLPQCSVWGGLEMLGLLTGAYSIALSPLPTMRLTPGPTPRQGKLPPLPEQKQRCVVMPAKQLPERHTSAVEQAETPGGKGTRMQPRPDESCSGSSTFGSATPVFDAGIDQSHVRMLPTESSHGAGQAPDPSVLEDTVSKLVESFAAAAATNLRMSTNAGQVMAKMSPQ